MLDILNGYGNVEPDTWETVMPLTYEDIVGITWSGYGISTKYYQAKHFIVNLIDGDTIRVKLDEISVVTTQAIFGWLFDHDSLANQEYSEAFGGLSDAIVETLFDNGYKHLKLEAN